MNKDDSYAKRWKTSTVSDVRSTSRDHGPALRGFVWTQVLMRSLLLFLRFVAVAMCHTSHPVCVCVFTVVAKRSWQLWRCVVVITQRGECRGVTPVPLTTLREPGSIVQPTHVAHSWPEPCRGVALPLSSPHSATCNTHTQLRSRQTQHHVHPPPPCPPKTWRLTHPHKGWHTHTHTEKETDGQVQYNEGNQQREVRNKPNKAGNQDTVAAVTSHPDPSEAIFLTLNFQYVHRKLFLSFCLDWLNLFT